MGAKATKAADNIFYKARIAAAKYNDKLNSREGAAEVLGYSKGSSVADWELGISIPTPQTILKMIDAYNAPELRNFFCREMCPLGNELKPLELEDLDRITIRTMASLSNAEEMKDSLLKITEDGKIDESEEPVLQKILKNLDDISVLAQSLKVWVEKYLE